MRSHSSPSTWTPSTPASPLPSWLPRPPPPPRHKFFPHVMDADSCWSLHAVLQIRDFHPGCWSLHAVLQIRDFHPGSWFLPISDPGSKNSNKKESGEKSQSFQKYGLGIWDPRSWIRKKSIPDHSNKKASDPGSESATLPSCLHAFLFSYFSFWEKAELRSREADSQSICADLDLAFL